MASHGVPSSAMTGADRSGNSMRRGPEHERAQERSDIARVLRVGLVVWPSFFLLDLAMIYLFFPASTVLRFAVYRVIPQLVLLAAFLVARRAEGSLRAARWGQLVAFNL